MKYALTILTLSALAFLSLISTAHEGDVMFNCHVSGNHKCGPATPWHGFVGSEE